MVGYDFETIKKGQHLSSWTVLNIRHPLGVLYYSRAKNCTGNYTLIGQSPIIQPLNPNEPVHIYLAFIDRIDQMLVSYLTKSSEYLPQCQYGFDPSSLQFQRNDTSITYKATDMCEEIANISGPHNFIDPGYMHTVLLEDLRPSTTYCYRVEDNEHGWSAIYSFFTRPKDGNELVNKIAYGDMSVTSNAKSTIDYVTARTQSINIKGLLHMGDISYARGVAIIWEAFMTRIQSIAARVPYMVSIGNHEYDHVTGGEKDSSGAPPPGGFRPSQYDHLFFVYQLINIDILGPSSIQYNWIENDLQSINRTRTPWLIIGSHRTMFTSEKDQTLFYKYHVDVNRFTQLHAYERSCPLYQQKCLQSGITIVLINMAGIGLDSRPYYINEWSQYPEKNESVQYIHFKFDTLD